jgi:hypothetical protein
MVAVGLVHQVVQQESTTELLVAQVAVLVKMLPEELELVAQGIPPQLLPHKEIMAVHQTILQAQELDMVVVVALELLVETG